LQESFPPQPHSKYSYNYDRLARSFRQGRGPVDEADALNGHPVLGSAVDETVWLELMYNLMQ